MRTPAVVRGIAERPFGPMPFARQVQTHALSNAADAFFAVSLAGSLFFNVSVDAARPRIILYLVLTMAPFAVIAPVIGPVIDKVPGGHRFVVATTCFLRGAVCLVMAGHLRTLSFYPEAFAVLVLGKTYSVAKSALVPRLVTDPGELVPANSRLSRLGTVGAAVGAGIGAGVLNLTSAPWTLRTGAVVFFLAGLVALRLPRPRAARRTSPAREREEVHAPRIVLAAWAMAALRAGVGFTMFLLAFALRGAGEPAWLYGVVLAAGGAGGFAGTFVAPILRRRVREVTMLTTTLVVPAVLALGAATTYVVPTLLAVVFALGMAANVGRQAFDSLVQRDAPDADRGRVFARFETRFQLAWVLGALVPVALRPPAWLGMLVLGSVLALAAFSFVTGTRSADRREPMPVGTGVRDLLSVGDDGPIAVHLLVTAERLAHEDLHDQAVVVAAAAVDAAPGHEADAGAEDRRTLARMRAEVLHGERRIGPAEAAAAIEFAARVLARVRPDLATAEAAYPVERRSATSQASSTHSTT